MVVLCTSGFFLVVVTTENVKVLLPKVSYFYGLQVSYLFFLLSGTVCLVLLLVDIFRVLLVIIFCLASKKFYQKLDLIKKHYYILILMDGFMIITIKKRKRKKYNLQNFDDF